jgi:hypothetical protein
VSVQNALMCCVSPVGRTHTRGGLTSYPRALPGRLVALGCPRRRNHRPTQATKISVGGRDQKCVSCWNLSRQARQRNPCGLSTRSARSSRTIIQLGHHRLIAPRGHHAAALDDTWIEFSVCGISWIRKIGDVGRRCSRSKLFGTARRPEDRLESQAELESIYSTPKWFEVED